MLTAAGRNVEASRKGLEQAEEEYRIVKERFESGRGMQLEILVRPLRLQQRPGDVAEGDGPGPLTRATINRRGQR